MHCPRCRAGFITILFSHSQCCHQCRPSWRSSPLRLCPLRVPPEARPLQTNGPQRPSRQRKGLACPAAWPAPCHDGRSTTRPGGQRAAAATPAARGAIVVPANLGGAGGDRDLTRTLGAAALPPVRRCAARELLARMSAAASVASLSRSVGARG